VEQVALTKAREKHERDCTVWQTVRAKTEAEFARREQELAEVQAEAAHLAAEQEKIEAAQLLLQQATAKLEQERGAWADKLAGQKEALAKITAKEGELAQMKKALAIKEQAHEDAVAHLAAEQEKF